MRSDVTRILTAIDNGDPAAAQDLLPLVCEELRRLAAQRVAKWQVRGGSGVARWIARDKGLRAEYVARLVVRSL